MKVIAVIDDCYLIVIIILTVMLCSK